MDSVSLLDLYSAKTTKYSKTPYNVRITTILFAEFINDPVFCFVLVFASVIKKYIYKNNYLRAIVE